MVKYLKCQMFLFNDTPPPCNVKKEQGVPSRIHDTPSLVMTRGAVACGPCATLLFAADQLGSAAWPDSEPAHRSPARTHDATNNTVHWATVLLQRLTLCHTATCADG